MSQELKLGDRVRVQRNCGRSEYPGRGARKSSIRGWYQGLASTFHQLSILSVSPMNEVTRILSAIEQGDAQAAEQLLPLVYDELRHLAAQKMDQEQPGQTLQARPWFTKPTFALSKSRGRPSGSVEAISAAAAEAMRRILIDDARSKARLKRGGDHQRVDLIQADVASVAAPDELLLIDEAVAKLAGDDPQAAQLVRLR